MWHLAGYGKACDVCCCLWFPTRTIYSSRPKQGTHARIVEVQSTVCMTTRWHSQHITPTNHILQGNKTTVCQTVPLRDCVADTLVGALGHKRLSYRGTQNPTQKIKFVQKPYDLSVEPDSTVPREIGFLRFGNWISRSQKHFNYPICVKSIPQHSDS